MSGDFPHDESVGEDFIQVAVRVRPVLGIEWEKSAFCSISEDSITITSNKGLGKTYSFDHVFGPETTQESLFLTVGKSLVSGCFEGYNGTIFAYGQTGSGKTHTMLGPAGVFDKKQQPEIPTTDKDRGLIPRSLEYIFMLIANRKNQSNGKATFLLKCSFIELYNEKLFDLLDNNKSVTVRERLDRGVFIQGAREKEIENIGDAYQALNQGWQLRKTSATSMNRESSRSHAIFILTIESQEPTKSGVIIKKNSQLNLVDLAGSERQKSAETKGERLKEASAINNSLTVLGRVITALVKTASGTARSTAKNFVPYRDSTLTRLLQDSLGGNARTCIVANVHSSIKCLVEIESTLHFATSAKHIRNKAKVNEDFSGESVERLKQEILELKEENRRLKRKCRDSQKLNAEHSLLSPTSPQEKTIPIETVDSERFLASMKMLQKYKKEKEALSIELSNQRGIAEMSKKELENMKGLVELKEDYIKCLEDGLSESNNQDPINKNLCSQLETLNKRILFSEQAHFLEISGLNRRLKLNPRPDEEEEKLEKEFGDLQIIEKAIKATSNDISISRSEREVEESKLETELEKVVAEKNQLRSNSDIVLAENKALKAELNRSQQNCADLQSQLVSLGESSMKSRKQLEERLKRMSFEKNSSKAENTKSQTKIQELEKEFGLYKNFRAKEIKEKAEIEKENLHITEVYLQETERLNQIIEEERREHKREADRLEAQITALLRIKEDEVEKIESTQQEIANLDDSPKLRPQQLLVDHLQRSLSKLLPGGSPDIRATLTPTSRTEKSLSDLNLNCL